MRSLKQLKFGSRIRIPEVLVGVCLWVIGSSTPARAQWTSMSGNPSPSIQIGKDVAYTVTGATFATGFPSIGHTVEFVNLWSKVTGTATPPSPAPSGANPPGWTFKWAYQFSGEGNSGYHTWNVANQDYNIYVWWWCQGVDDVTMTWLPNSFGYYYTPP